MDKYISAVGCAREPAAAPSVSIITCRRELKKSLGLSTPSLSPRAMTPPTRHLFERVLYRPYAAAGDDLGVFSKEALTHPRFGCVGCTTTALVTARRDEVSSARSLRHKHPSSRSRLASGSCTEKLETSRGAWRRLRAQGLRLAPILAPREARQAGFAGC